MSIAETSLSHDFFVHHTKYVQEVVCAEMAPTMDGRCAIRLCPNMSKCVGNSPACTPPSGVRK